MTLCKPILYVQCKSGDNRQGGQPQFLTLPTQAQPLLRPLTRQRANVPSNVITPASSLDPVDGPRVDPHQVSRTLDETVDGDVGLVKVFEDGPPRAGQVVHSMPAR